MSKQVDMFEKPKILCLDVAFAAMGWAIAEVFPEDLVVLEAGAIKTKKESNKRHIYVADDDARRAAETARALIELRKRFRPQGIVAELPGGGAQSARAARTMGIATGIAVMFVEFVLLPVEWYTPGEGKLALGGSKKASKNEMISAAMKRWPDAGWPEKKGDQEHAADAAGVLVAAVEGNLVRAMRGM